MQTVVYFVIIKMDSQFQDQLLNLQLLESKVKEYPARFLNSLKFSMDFDKDYRTSQAVRSRIEDLAQIRTGLEHFLSQSEVTRAIKEEVVRSAEGNRAFFDQLMVQHGISEQQVSDIVGEFIVSSTVAPEPRSDTDYASSVGGEDLPEDDEELSFELRKDNLAEMRKFTHKNSLE